MSLCPEGGKRAAMTDDEFWAHVLQSDEMDFPLIDEESLTDEPCRVCGERRACGYDTEGRPMYHADEQADA